MSWLDVYTKQGQRWVFRKRIIREGRNLNINTIKKELCVELSEPGEILDPQNIKVVPPVEFKPEKSN